MARHGDMRYLSREYAFEVTVTGERVPLAGVPLGVELLNANHPEDDPPPEAAGTW